MGDPLEDFAHRAVGHSERARIDRATAEVMDALADGGVNALLLKGPVIARWLYGPDEVRGYGDCDILAAPDRFGTAGRSMRAAGFHLHADEATHPEVRDEGRSQIWHRLPEDVWIDLQWRLPGFDLSPGQAFELLWVDRETITLGVGSVAVAGEPARALYLATGVAADEAGSRKPVIDLERAIAQLDPEIWQAAARLARQIHALPALSAGLHHAAAGEALADRLGLRD